MKKYFKMANIYFYIKFQISLEWDPYIRHFFVDEIEVPEDVIGYELIVVEKLPKPKGNVIYKGQNQIIYKHKNGEDRQHFFLLHDDAYMLYHETENRNVIYFSEKYKHTLKHQYMLFNAIAAEKLFLKYDAMILHSSYIIVDNKAIIFTAPSGTGKSTQAGLWKKYKNAQIINGDRCLIQKRENGWYACGIPICGSSDICINKEAKIKKIIYLGQSRENIIENLNPTLAVRKLMSETTVNFWNVNSLDKVIELWSDFVQQNTVCNFLCTKDEKSVKVLEKYIGEKG